jgi:glycine betaine catabolism A
MQESLPSRCYTTSEFFLREQSQIFAREWFCAGREEDLPAPGNHAVLEIANESILVVRTPQGQLKAHYNVCRHRGSRLCEHAQDPQSPDARWDVTLPAAVNANSIRCPYHQWTYNLDGELLGAPFLKDSADFRKEDFSLYPVAIDTWAGFFFLKLENSAKEKNPSTLQSQLGAAATRTRRYPLADLRTAHTITYDLSANWKLILENYNECYHCGGVHPELCEVVPDFKQAGGSNLNWDEGIPHRPGAYTFTRSGTTTRVPFPGLNEAEKTRHKGELCFPNLMLSLACDHAAAFLLWPQAPDRTRIVCRFLFDPNEIAKSDFNPADAVEFWDLINRQDWAICERVQQGLSSRVHKFGYYAPMEDPSLDIRNYIQSRLGPLPE